MSAELRYCADVQLFKRDGTLVADVNVKLDDGRWPDAIQFRDATFALQAGRYVEVSSIPLATAAPP
jgi:hypothetical protein